MCAAPTHPNVAAKAAHPVAAAAAHLEDAR
jgi:hypothetical protein